MKNNEEKKPLNSDPYDGFIGNLERLNSKLKNTSSVQERGIYSRKIAEIITDIKDFIPSKTIKKMLKEESISKNLPQYIADNHCVEKNLVDIVVIKLNEAKLISSMIDKTTTQDDALLNNLIHVEKYNEYTDAIEKLGKLLGEKKPGDSSMWKHKIKWEVRDILKKNNLSLPKGFKLPIGIPDEKDIKALQEDLRQRVSVIKTGTKYNLELQNRNKTQKTSSNHSSPRLGM